MSKKKILTIAIIVALAILGALLAILVAPKAPDTREPVEKRMQDKKYIKELDALQKEQKMLVKELQILRAKLKAASEKDPEGKGEEVRALKAQELQYAKKFDVLRRKSEATVRNRMLKDIDLNGKTK
ncbi:MAG: hypothetical protein J6S51_00190 [Kiritimatiellae bacterium]|nr:hypothetical protein [Kiritimatiellia bacterium]